MNPERFTNDMKRYKLQILWSETEGNIDRKWEKVVKAYCERSKKRNR